MTTTNEINAVLQALPVINACTVRFEDALTGEDLAEHQFILFEIQCEQAYERHLEDRGWQEALFDEQEERRRGIFA